MLTISDGLVGENDRNRGGLIQGEVTIPQGNLVQGGLISRVCVFLERHLERLIIDQGLSHWREV